MILHSYFNFTIHSFEDKGNFAVYDKDCRNFLTQALMPGMRAGADASRWITDDSLAKISDNYT